MDQQNLGRVEGVLHETVTRVDRLEARHAEHDEAVLRMLTEIKDRVSGGIWIGTLAGAFAGAFTGAIASMLCVYFLIDLIRVAAKVSLSLLM